MRRLMGIVGAISFGLILAFLLLELVLRILGYSFPSFVAMDPYRGWSLYPNQEGWTRNEAGKVFLHISSDGLRDVEHLKEKVPNTFRVVILGDSYAEAAQVQIEQAFWYVMGQRLSQCGALHGRKVEVINLGVEGYGTDQELLTLREKAWDYSPDLVVLAFTPSNDVSDNSKALAVDKDKPFFRYRDGALVIDTSFKDSFAYHVRESWPMQLYYHAVNHSRVLQFFRQAKNAWRQKKLAEVVQGTTDSSGGSLGLADKSYLSPNDPTWKDAWAITDALLQEVSTEVKSKGAMFMVVTVTRAIQVSPDIDLRRKYTQNLGVPNLFYPEDRIAALGKNGGFPVLTLAQPYQEYAERTRESLHFPAGHWNANGHRLAGQMIAGRICEILESPDAPSKP